MTSIIDEELVKILRDPPSNPIVARLTRKQPRRSPWRTTLWFALALFVVSLVATAWGWYFSPDTVPPTTLALAVVAWAFALPSSLITSRITAITTARHARSEEYQQLRLTTLSKTAVVWGYAFATLYRMRLVLAVMVGLTPAFVGGAAHLSATISLAVGLPPSAPENVGNLALTLAAVAVGLWGLSLLGAMLGVWLGLWWREPVGAASVAMMSMLLFILGALFALRAAMGVWQVMLAVLLAGGVWALAIGAMRLARRWV